MFPFCIPFLKPKKKKAHPGKVILVFLGICAGLAALGYAAVKVYRKFCVIDKINKEAIDDDEPLAGEEETEEACDKACTDADDTSEQS